MSADQRALRQAKRAGLPSPLAKPSVKAIPAPAPKPKPAPQAKPEPRKRGRKPVAITPAVTSAPIPVAPAPVPIPGITSAWDGRGSLEDYLKTQLAATSSHYDALIATYQQQQATAEANGLVEQAAKAANGMRQAITAKQNFILNITKQFQLMEQLRPDESTDPKFTPIRFVLSLEPPAESIVEKQFHVLPEDIQPK